jgi:antitoxin component YwqK of YwqJK toxin-antitoxin module
LISSINGYTQTSNYEIYLKKLTTDKIKTGYEYQLVNPKDSVYVTIKYSGDFGMVTSTYFVLKDNLSDGEYKIFVEHQLRKEAFFKNGLKDNSWIEYRENNEKQIIKYSNGKIKSVFEYFSNGSVKSESCFNSKGIQTRIIYDENGILKMKEYFQENKQYKIKKYNCEGKRIETKKINN